MKKTQLRRIPRKQMYDDAIRWWKTAEYLRIALGMAVDELEKLGFGTKQEIIDKLRAKLDAEASTPAGENSPLVPAAS